MLKESGERGFLIECKERDIHRRGAEDAEGAQRRRFNSLRNLCVLCVCGGESLPAFTHLRFGKAL
jgi:hypothetical protein